MKNRNLLIIGGIVAAILVVCGCCFVFGITGSLTSNNDVSSKPTSTPLPAVVEEVEVENPAPLPTPTPEPTTMPESTATPEPTTVSEPQQDEQMPTPTVISQPQAGIGVSRAEIQSVFESSEIGFVFEVASDVNGQPRVMGSSENGLATLELIGPSEELVSASIMIGLPNDDQEALLLNNLYAAGLLNLVAPDWEGGVDWYTNNIVNVATTDQTEISTTYEGLEVSLQGLQELGIILLAIKPSLAEASTTAEQTTPSESAPAPVSEQPQLEVLSHQSYEDGGWFHIVGEVRNNSNTPMEFVEVIATLYDDANNVVGTDFTFTELDVIPPGGKTPFETGTDQYQDITNYQLQVQGEPSELPRQDLVVLSHNHYEDNGWLHIRGEVQNTGSTPAEFVEVIVTLYDTNGNVVGTDFTFADLDTIPAGGVSPFETGTDHYPGFDHYELQVQGM